MSGGGNGSGKGGSGSTKPTTGASDIFQDIGKDAKTTKAASASKSSGAGSASEASTDKKTSRKKGSGEDTSGTRCRCLALGNLLQDYIYILTNRFCLQSEIWRGEIFSQPERRCRRDQRRREDRVGDRGGVEQERRLRGAGEINFKVRRRRRKQGEGYIRRKDHGRDKGIKMVP